MAEVTMRVAFAGLAHSHPFSDARSAHLAGITDLCAWDADDPSRLSAFVDQYGAATYGSLAELLVSEPDLVIVTPRPHRIAATVSAVLGAGIPCFLNKVPAVSLAALADLSAAVRGHADRFFTSSVLRFAPELRRLARQLDGREIYALELSVRHDIGDFLTPARRWQDDPKVGGGTAISMGLHAWEMADALLGRPILPRGGATATRVRNTLSEDIAALTGVTDTGVLVTASISGVGEEELYRVVAHTDAGPLDAVLGAGEPYESLGYLGCFDAARKMAAGAAPPVPWSTSEGLIASCIRAATFARERRLYG